MNDTITYFVLLVYSFLTTAIDSLLKVISETVGVTFCEESGVQRGICWGKGGFLK